MRSIFRIFFGAAGTRPFLVLSCLLLAGVFEILSIGALLPLFNHIGGPETAGSSELNVLINQLIGVLGFNNDFETIIALVMTTMIIKGVLSFGAMGYVSFAIAKVVSAMRVKLVNQLLNARWSYFADQRIGRIANALSNDATRAGSAYQRSARFVAYFVQAGVYVVAALLISRELALVGIGVGVILIVATSWLIKVSRKSGYEQTDSTSDLTTYVADTMNNIKPLKAMERQAPYLELFGRKIKVLHRSLVRQSLATYGRHYGHDVAVALFVGAGIYAATKYLQIPLSELIVSGIVFFQVTTIISKLQATLQDAAQLESAFWRLDEMLESTANAEETNPGTRHATLEEGAHYRNVSFAHGEYPVVANVDLDIPAKKITVLQGGSGAGKTTLIDLLIGLHRTDEGTILLDDVPISEIDLKDWRRKIGYVPQELSLFHGTIRDNITLGDETINDGAVVLALENAGAAAFIKELPEGLDTVVGEMGTKLSGGQRQRIALARALAAEPTLLILDEVTSALDPETEKEIVANIRELSDRYTIVAVTHRSAWTRIADRLYNIKAGQAMLINGSKANRSRTSTP
ncbi:MAG: ABC transporter ATP-binding protein [Alphaproteobacteria bacterium]|nr:ABC transporter ATP-binding protein [Alphaproteobacteria bacterium]